jgi:hypothetical protein
VIEVFISKEPLLDKSRKTLRARMSFTDFDSERRHVQEYRQYGGFSKEFSIKGV